LPRVYDPNVFVNLPGKFRSVLSTMCKRKRANGPPTSPSYAIAKVSSISCHCWMPSALSYRLRTRLPKPRDVYVAVSALYKASEECPANSVVATAGSLV